MDSEDGRITGNVTDCALLANEPDVRREDLIRKLCVTCEV